MKSILALVLILVELTQRRLGIVTTLAAVDTSGQGVQGCEEEHSNSNKLEAGGHGGVRCLLRDLNRMRKRPTASTRTPK